MKRITNYLSKLTVRQKLLSVSMLMLVLYLAICVSVLVPHATKHESNWKKLDLELEPNLMAKSEYLRLRSEVIKARQAMPDNSVFHAGNVFDGTGTMQDTLNHLDKLTVRQLVDTALIALCMSYDGLSAETKQVAPYIFWVLWLLCGIGTTDAACRQIGGRGKFGLEPLLWQLFVICTGMCGTLAFVILTIRDACVEHCVTPLLTFGNSSVRRILNRLKSAFATCGPDRLHYFLTAEVMSPRKQEADDFARPVRKWFDDSDEWDALMRKEGSWHSIWWQGIRLADGSSLAQLVEKILEPIDKRSQPAMRFNISTVLKAHMFLLHSQKSWSDANVPDVWLTNPYLKSYCESVLKYVVEFEETAGKVILKILKLLDRHGNCPSVTGKVKNAEGLYNQSFHEILQKVPLWLHTLNVTGRLTSRNCGNGEPLARLLILALAHDLGKMPHVFRSMSESHEKASLRVLDGISCFDCLPFAEEIREAILEHHSESPRTRLGRMLRNADDCARAYEIDEDRAIEQELWEMLSEVEATFVAQSEKDFCRVIYPYFMDREKLESLRYNLRAYDNTEELVADVERILRQPPYLFSDAYRVGTVIADIAGGTLRRMADCKK